jgi:hypothetical protein
VATDTPTLAAALPTLLAEGAAAVASAARQLGHDLHPWRRATYGYACSTACRDCGDLAAVDVTAEGDRATVNGSGGATIAECPRGAR